MSVERVQKLQREIDVIRNICIIAHVDHGKTTLCDSLLAKAGLISCEDAGEKHAIALRQQEKDRKITIKSTGISLPFHKDGEDYLVNLVDSPGHVDFSSEVTAALRITDGALVVVDCIEGVCVQTETVTRQALSERIKPVLHINKVDRAIAELRLTGEEIYQKFFHLVENVNHLLETYQDETLGCIVLDPRKGSVSFGSGKQGWAFTIPQFAQMIAKKMKKDQLEIQQYLWGDYYHDPETGAFTNKPLSKSGKPLERFFVQAILNPILRVFDLVAKQDLNTLNQKIFPQMNIKLTEQEKQQTGSKLLKSIFQQWIPAADSLISMIIDHLPSPRVAQRYRVENLYSGGLDDPVASAIRQCDPNGPLMMFVSKMIDPKGDGKRFYAFGRIFSGTISSGQEVYIFGPNYVVGEKKDCFVKRIPGLVLMMGSKTENVSSVSCGNTVAIQGLEKILVKSGTITSDPTASPITPMKFSVSPIVQRAICPNNLAQLKKFTEGLKRLEKSDPCLKVIFSEKSSEMIIAGAGELHIEVAIGELADILGEDVPFTVSPPVVGFCETVTTQSSTTCMGKSPNRHNRLYFTAEPLEEEIIQAIEKETIDPNDKSFPKVLSEKYGWDKSLCSRVWFFSGTNCLVDQTHGVSYLSEIKDSIKTAFEGLVQSSILCEEPLRGVRFNLVDAVLHADTIHRGPGQLIPPAQRAMSAAILASKPTLLEPIYNTEIQTETEVVGKIYSTLSQRRGGVHEEIPKIGTPLCIVRGFLPVLESFGISATLREATSGRAFPQMIFDHWRRLGDDLETPLVRSTLADIRKRKSLKPNLPTFEELNDKL
uniref:Tr-type G domain-containing protein n=1 Tax=Arcella intermedia TaxID=1963864 RepID=A0A6B2KY02_9EUKA